MKPTDAQIKEFWEWCGFEYVERTDLPGYWGWRDPEGYHALCCMYPPDLNNLFKHAVPKLQTADISVEIRCYRKDTFGVTTKDWSVCDIIHEEPIYNYTRDKDPALALFWAIYAVMKEVQSSNSTKIT